MTDLMTVSMSGHFRTLAVVSVHSTFLVLNFKMPYFETKRGSFFLFTLFTFLLFLAPIPKWGHRVETVALVICCRHPLDQYGVARRSKRSESSLLFFHTYLFLFLIDPNRSFDMEAPDLFEVWIPVVLKPLLLIQTRTNYKSSEGGSSCSVQKSLKCDAVQRVYLIETKHHHCFFSFSFFKTNFASFSQRRKSRLMK